MVLFQKKNKEKFSQCGYLYVKDSLSNDGEKFFGDLTNDGHPIAKDEFIQDLVKNVFSYEWSLNVVVLVWVTLLDSRYVPSFTLVVFTCF
jgi:hypothetical protein